VCCAAIIQHNVAGEPSRIPKSGGIIKKKRQKKTLQRWHAGEEGGMIAEKNKMKGLIKKSVGTATSRNVSYV
jgi:hypothetical protein